MLELNFWFFDFFTVNKTTSQLVTIDEIEAYESQMKNFHGELSKHVFEEKMAALRLKIENLQNSNETDDSEIQNLIDSIDYETLSTNIEILKNETESLRQDAINKRDTLAVDISSFERYSSKLESDIKTMEDTIKTIEIEIEEKALKADLESYVTLSSEVWNFSDTNTIYFHINWIGTFFNFKLKRFEIFLNLLWKQKSGYQKF